MHASYRVHADVAWRRVDGIVFLLTSDSRYHQIDDEVGTTVWGVLAGVPAALGATLDDCVAAVTARFAVSPETARADIATFLEALQESGAVEVVDDPATSPRDEKRSHG